MRLIYLALLLTSPLTFSNDLISLFNDSFRSSSLAFIQSSINPYTNSIDKSEGRILKNKEGTIFYVDYPFKEKYELTKDQIIITDIELNQTSRMQLSDLEDNMLIDILLNGLTLDNPSYDLEFDRDTIFIKSSLEGSYNEIEVKFKENKIYYLKYNDNLNIENLIMFKNLTLN